MDDEFFASVLKKWAYASQQVVDLKKRLDDVEKERNTFRDEIASLRARDTEKLIEPGPAPAPKPRYEKVLKLQEAGDMLDKARSEYQKLREELRSACATQTSLEQQVESLIREKSQLVSQQQVSQVQYAELNSELSRLRLEKETMTNRVFDLTIRLQHSEKDKAKLESDSVGARSEEPLQVGKLQRRMSSLETQIQELHSFARSLETENETLRDELVVSREALQRTKESNKNLLTTIASLSRIARNVVGVPEVVLTSQQEHRSAQAAKSVIRESSPEALGTKHAIKEERKLENDSLFNDVTIVADNHPPVTIPPHRFEALASLPVIIPDADINDEDNKFTRSFASAAIGGSIQSLIMQATSGGTEFTKRRKIEEYLCPRLDHNPWCPSSPGQHGFMFAGAGKEKQTYMTPQLRNLFVGLVKNDHNEPRYFRYLGVYQVSRVNSLSPAEWQMLCTSVKTNYIDAAKEKSKDMRTNEEILTAYNSGELSVPCLQLQCVDFDEELYTGLLAFQPQHRDDWKGRLIKRNRDDDHESSTPPQRNKRNSKRSSQ